MFYQIQNLSLKKFNQFEVSSKSKIVGQIKARNWKIEDCKIIALEDQLKNGFNVKTGNRNKRGRQFAGRAGK